MLMIFHQQFLNHFTIKSNGQIINLGSGKKISVYDLVLKIFKIIKVGRIKFDQNQNMLVKMRLFYQIFKRLKDY